MSKEQLKQMIKDVDAAIAGVEVVRRRNDGCGTETKVISRFGVGVNNFDLKKQRKEELSVLIARVLILHLLLSIR